MDAVLKDHETHKVGHVVDVGRFSHCRALVAQGIAIWTTEPADQDATGDAYVDVLHSQDTDGDVTGPTAAEIAGDYLHQADNTWVDPATVVSANEHTGTTGSVFFAGAGGAGSSPTEDNANFFWDDTANELAIGHNSPDARLHIKRTVSAESDHILRVERDGLTENAIIFYVGAGAASGDLVMRGDGHAIFGGDQAVASAQVNIKTSDSIAFRIDQDGVGSSQAVIIATDGVTGDAIDVSANSITTATALDISANGLTSGAIANFASASTSVVNRTLVAIQNTSTAATGAIPLVCNQLADNSIIQLRKGFGEANSVFDVDFNGRTMINRGAAPTQAAQLHVDQASSSAAIPVLTLDQGDIDDTFINFIGTSAADGTRSISSDTTEDSAKFGAIRVEINGTTKWIRIYDDES